MSELMQAVSRWAIVATLGGLGAACSADSMRFSETPFANPFATDAAEPRTTGSVERPKAAPVRTASVRAEPLQPVASASPAAPTERYASTGSPGWTAEGGTPITVSAGDTLTAISNRYGVPAPAILSANGITAAQVTPGRRVVIPVYSVSGNRPARAAAPAPIGAPKAVAAGNPASEGRVVATSKIAVVKPAPKTIADAAAPRVRPGQVVAKPSPAAKVAAAEPKTVGSIEPKHPRPGRSTPAAKVEASAKAEPAKVAASAKPIAPKAEPKPVAKVVRTEPLPAKAEPKVAKAEAAKAEPKVAKAEPAKSEPAKPEPKVAKAEPAKPAKPEAAKVAEAPKPAAKAPEPAKVAAAAPVPAKEVETTASVQPAAAPTAEFRWPARGRVISGFGGSGSNEGVNIALPEGTPVKAAESGTVAYAGSEVKGYGNLVLIRHDNGYVSAYAHNGDLDVKRGQKVTRGQTIAKSGQTGNVTSPQLHFEIRKGSTPVDPIRYLASN